MSVVIKSQKFGVIANPPVIIGSVVLRNYSEFSKYVFNTIRTRNHRSY